MLGIRQSLKDILGATPTKPKTIINTNDGEADDIAATAATESISQNANIPLTVIPAVGNPEIIISQELQSVKKLETDDQKTTELQARVTLQTSMLPHAEVLANGPINCVGEHSELPQAVKTILDSNPSDHKVVLHTASLANHYAAANTATFIYSGGANLKWAMEKLPEGKDELTHQNEQHTKLFSNITDKSNSTLFIIEANPLLGANNKILESTTPLTYTIYADHLDGKAGTQLGALVDKCNDQVRPKQAGKLAKGIIDALANIEDEINTLYAACSQENTVALDFTQPQVVATLQSAMDQEFNPASYAKVKQALNNLIKKLPDDVKKEMGRPKNIYLGTCYNRQALIADQLAALAMEDYVDGCENGLLSYCRAVTFTGVKKIGRNYYPQYEEVKPETAKEARVLFHANLERNIRAKYPELRDATITDFVNREQENLLNYLDVRLAVHMLLNPTMITEETRESLLKAGSAFAKDLNKKARQAIQNGFEFPNSAQRILNSLQTSAANKVDISNRSGKLIAVAIFSGIASLAYSYKAFATLFLPMVILLKASHDQSVRVSSLYHFFPFVAPYTINGDELIFMDDGSKGYGDLEDACSTILAQGLKTATFQSRRETGWYGCETYGGKLYKQTESICNILKDPNCQLEELKFDCNIIGGSIYSVREIIAAHKTADTALSLKRIIVSGGGLEDNERGQIQDICDREGVNVEFGAQGGERKESTYH